MKTDKLFLIGVLIVLLCTSCKKDIVGLSQIASVTVINASPDNPSIVMSISDTMVPFYVNQAPISYGAFQEFGYPSGNVPLTVVSASDTTHPLFQTELHLS